MIFIMSRSNMPRPVILTSRFHINDAQATGESNGNVNMEEAPEEGTDMMQDEGIETAPEDGMYITGMDAAQVEGMDAVPEDGRDAAGVEVAPEDGRDAAGVEVAPEDGRDAAPEEGMEAAPDTHVPRFCVPCSASIFIVHALSVGYVSFCHIC